jgi:hypothetical protein
MRGDGGGGAEKLANGKPRRRTAESRVPVSDRTNFALKRRKIESKRRFSNGVPGRSTMTMFDLIYYNPDNGTEMLRRGMVMGPLLEVGRARPLEVHQQRVMKER